MRDIALRRRARHDGGVDTADSAPSGVGPGSERGEVDPDSAPSGVDPGFLGLRSALHLPTTDLPTIELPATHHTVLLRPDRRLAAVAAVDIDGSRLVEVPRRGRWFLDPRAPTDAQTGPEVYLDNDLDRGHLVRRRDPCWGPEHVAVRASAETFSYANAAPQVAVFNQSKALWNGLENYLLSAADAARARLTVLTGPVLADGDPEYRGSAVPRAFWKVAAWAGSDGRLAATGYLLDQGGLLERFLARAEGAAAAAAAPVTEPTIGAFRTYQVTVELTGLDLGPLPGADRLGTRAQTLAGDRLKLRGYEDVVLRA